MSNYSKVLEFFMENNIVLNKEQLEALKEEFLDEGARSKYINNLADKQEKVKKEMERTKQLRAVATDDTKKRDYDERLQKLRSDYDSIADTASRYSAKVGVKTGLNEKDKDYQKRYEVNSRYDSPDEMKRKHNALDDRRDLSKLRGKNGKINLGDGKDSAYDLGAYNRYGQGSYSHPYSSYDKSAKESFNNKFDIDNSPNKFEKKQKELDELRNKSK